MNRFLFWGIALVVFAGCATADEGVVFRDKTFQANPGSLVEFLPAGDKPIHLGDNVPLGIQDSVDYLDSTDIPDEHRNPKAPLAYGWKFNLQQLPSKGGELIVSMYSLAPHRGCSTTVYINDKLVKDLSLLPSAAESTTFAKFSVSKEYFRVGLNQLVIAERPCKNILRDPDDPFSLEAKYNDSLIKSVLLVLP